MYRTSDPRFRRRLNELGATVESATQEAQSSIYIFGQRYVRPCFESVGECFTTCLDASCPTLNLSQRDRLRRQRGRGTSRGRAELSFDFYDDWDEDETDGLLGWGGNDDFDRLIAGSGAGYGTVQQTQPARQRGMSYPKARRKSTAEGVQEGAAIPGGSFFGRLFGGKAVRYKPSAAGLQEHPGARRLGRDLTEGEALLEENEHSEGTGRRHRRARSGTATSGGTTDSFSSRGDIFPSDEEDDAIPLDDEFAMVLERRNTQSGPETESSSGRTRSLRRGKRPSAGSRASTRRTVSSRSTRSSNGKKRRSRSGSSAAQTPEDELPSEMVEEEDVPTLTELKQEERQIEREEEAEVERKRLEAQKLAAERGFAGPSDGEERPSKEGTPHASTPAVTPAQPAEEPSQLPTPLPTDDEEEPSLQPARSEDGTSEP